MKRFSLFSSVILSIIVAVLVAAPIHAQDVTPTPTPTPTTPPPFTPCAEPTQIPDATPAPAICAHLIAKLSQPTALGDFYIDGMLAASQVATLDTQVTALQNHKIEARAITDPTADSVFQWILSYPSYAYLTPGAERTTTLYVYKKFLKGFLHLTCSVVNVKPEDGATCQPVIDDVPASPVAPGTTAVINLTPGSHNLVVKLAPEEAWYSSTFQRTLSIYAGASTYVTSSFTPMRAIPPLVGAGQTVTGQIEVGFQASRVRITHDGSSNFYVWVYDQNGERDLLVNTIGPYSGSTPLYTPGTYYFEIGADGNWMLKIEPLVQNNAQASIEGVGDYVSDLFTPAITGYVPYQFSHTGSRNFYVWLTCGSNRQLLQNKIGPVESQAVAYFSGVPCFWVVGADGAWSIHPK